MINYGAMKPTFRALTLLFFVSVFLIADLFAAEIAAQGTPARKLQRGFLNVALSPIEISHEMVRDKNVESAIPTWVTNFGRGSVFMVGRALAGVYDLVTAPLPLPAGYAPIVYPEFPWEHLAEEKG